MNKLKIGQRVRIKKTGEVRKITYEQSDYYWLDNLFLSFHRNELEPLKRGRPKKTVLEKVADFLDKPKVGRPRREGEGVSHNRVSHNPSRSDRCKTYPSSKPKVHKLINTKEFVKNAHKITDWREPKVHKIEKIELEGRNKNEYGLSNGTIPDMWIDATELATKINEIINKLNHEK